MSWRGIGCISVLLFVALVISACGGDGGGNSPSEETGVMSSGVQSAAPTPAAKSDGGGRNGPPLPAVGDGGGPGPAVGIMSKKKGGPGPSAGTRSLAVAAQAAAPAEPQYDFSYTIVSASALPVGVRVAVVRADISGSCVMPGRVSAFSPVASGAVTEAGSVSLRFNDSRSSPFIEIIYIDRNDSGRLDFGDRIWGANPKDPAGICFSPNLAGENRVDWDGVAAVIGGSATYNGDAQDFLAAAVGESQLPAGSLIVGETGYEDL